ncbi:MAG: protein-L-isoaspartate(D-aspartate) O-methyltransferase [Candidatus Sabulitectum sp.]|nr:protein-L-isoaspartate(D-aspartate) O-methyltransferase [Candidatus Sabulitectum sp.]
MISKAIEMTVMLDRLFPDRSARVLSAMSEVQRDVFVDPGWKRMAYTDRSLPIGHGQTISKPATVFRMLSALEPVFGGKLLETGSGSGYLASVASRLFSRVFCVERILDLVESSRTNLLRTGAGNVVVRYGDGSSGWVEHAPFDGILFSAGAPELPVSLVSQLREGGLAGVPVGIKSSQEFVVWKKVEGKLERISSFTCSFVPLIGKEGWNG